MFDNTLRAQGSEFKFSAINKLMVLVLVPVMMVSNRIELTPYVLVL